MQVGYTPRGQQLPRLGNTPVQVLRTDLPMAVRVVPLRFGGQAFKTVKLMTYNVERFSAPHGKSQGKPAASVKALGEVIRRENPDILALQEVESKVVLEDFSKTELGNAYNAVCATNSHDPNGIKNAFLYKKDITLASWTSHNQSHCKQTPCLLRDALLAKFQFTTDTGAQDSLYAVSVHLKSMRGGEARTNPRRIEESQVINSLANQVIQADPKARLAVMGDFNTKFTTPYGQKVMNTLGVVGSNRMMIEVFDGKVPPPPTQRGLLQPEKLDYIFVTPNLFQDKIKAVVNGGFTAWPWAQASDHLPTSVTVNAEASAGKKPGQAAIPFASAARKPLRVYA